MNPDRAAHQGRLVVALEAEGFIEANDTWHAAVGVLCEWLGSQSDIASARELVELATRSIELRPATSAAGLVLRGLQATAFGRLGKVTQAVVAFEELLAVQTQMLGPFHRDSLTTRNNLAGALRESGRLTDAIGQYHATLEERANTWPRAS